MTTPIYDFVRRYADSNPLRLHMPGHKGIGRLGAEPLDITEVSGADSLYEADGIIRESEANAGRNFGTDTFYSAEGSSLAIRAMLYLAGIHAREHHLPFHVLAVPNVHKTFLSAAALLDFSLTWAECSAATHLSCTVSVDALEEQYRLMAEKPSALYVTSPDYLGATAPIRELADFCRRHGMLLLTDNAHGAYLKFLPTSLHPMDLGADLCCDSAHKTLPVLTGGAYLHISKTADPILKTHAKQALALFGSTSPSYLILQSLDLANPYLAEEIRPQMAAFLPKIKALRTRLEQHGFTLFGEEPLKITVKASEFGCTGYDLARRLEEDSVICEFADRDFLVLMLTPALSDADLERIGDALCAVLPQPPLPELPAPCGRRKQVLSVRQAMLAVGEWVPTEACVGRILASPSVGCPPAVPIAVCGQELGRDEAARFAAYQIPRVFVVKES